MFLGVTYSPTVPGGGVASYKLQPVFTYIMVIGKCTDVFRGIFLVLEVGLREGAMWEDLSLEKICMGEKINEKGAGRISLSLSLSLSLSPLWSR